MKFLVHLESWENICSALFSGSAYRFIALTEEGNEEAEYVGDLVIDAVKKIGHSFELSCRVKSLFHGGKDVTKEYSGEVIVLSNLTTLGCEIVICGNALC